jgi:hypothetical protein
MRSSEFKFESYRLEGPQPKTAFTVSVADSLFHNLYGPAILREVSERLVEELTKEWKERHGEALLNELSPAAVADAIRQKVVAKVLA